MEWNCEVGKMRICSTLPSTEGKAFWSLHKKVFRKSSARTSMCAMDLRIEALFVFSDALAKQLAKYVRDKVTVSPDLFPSNRFPEINYCILQ